MVATMRSLLLVAVVLLASRIHSINATCAGAGYDVSVADRDLFFNTTDYEWWFHPCGSVSSASSAVCGSTTLFPYGSMLCQRPQGSSDAYNLAIYNSSTQVLWTETSAHNGVEYRTQDGDLCGNFRREVTASFQCDPTATTPAIVSITEVETCWYTVVVKTSSACSAVGNTASNTVGSSMWSTQCGAGIYDLSSISANDMVWQDTDYIWYVRLCGPVSNSACNSIQPTSVCQQPKSAINSPTDASHFNTSEAALWTITPNGMSVQIQDGAICSAIGDNVRRQVTYNLICNPYITVPFISFISEVETCHYTVVIQSPAVCTGSNAPEMGYCGGVGADFSQITTDFYLRSGNYDWYIRPCGVLSPFTTTACGSKASACQVLINATSGNLISVWNASIAHEAVTWTVLPQATSYSLQDGGLCGAISNHPRELTVKFECDSNARTPVFFSVTEVSTCYYTAVIRTSLACYRQAPVDPNAVGYTYTDSVCGGERWDFSNIRSYGDLTYDSNSSSATEGFMYVIDMCGRVANTRCSSVQPTSFCQYAKGNTNTYSLSYMAANIDATYTINANGITMSYADGTSCGGIPSRVAVINIICDGTTPPVLQSVSEYEICHYVATVRAQCVAGSTSPLDSSSSTGPAAPVVIPITAPTVSACSGAGYDLTQDAQSEYVFTDASYNWYFRPCAVVSFQRSSVCGNAAQFPYGSMLCQQPINQTYAYNIAIYNSTTSARWVAIPGGVSYSIQDGDFCGASNFRREVNVVFQCDPSATTTQIVGIVENELCWYQVTMRSARACTPVGATGGNTIGSSFLSTQCGGGIYDLSSLSSTDLLWKDNNYDWSLRLCGQVSNTNCSSVQPTSLCQFDRGTTAYDASHWNASDPAIWTITNDGITAQIQDGTLCTAIGANARRQVTFDMRCNNVVSVPYISYIKEIETCHYTVVIQTPAVCSGSNAPTNGICSGAGYDMSGLDTDLTLSADGWNWYLRVCAPLSPYTTTACGAGASMCQQSVANPSSAYPISYWNSSVAQSVSWLAVSNGVQYSVQDGAPCPAVGAAYRELTVLFECDSTAGSPVLISVVEVETCWYKATIRTSAACFKQAPVNTNAVGYSYNDFGCGGSRFASDFANLASQGDLSYDTNSSSVSSGYMIYLRMCGAVSNPLCNSAQPTSFCQIGKPVVNSTNIYSLASITSTTQVQYTLNTNGVTMFVADGTVCGGIPYRASSIQLICDGTSPARIDNWREVEDCHYSAVVRASCSIGPSPNGGGSGSSSSSSLSGGAIAGIVIGVVVGCLILFVVLFCVCCGQYRGNKKSDMSENHTGSGRFDSIEESRVENDPTEIEMGESGHTDD